MIPEEGVCLMACLRPVEFVVGTTSVQYNGMQSGTVNMFVTKIVFVHVFVLPLRAVDPMPLPIETGGEFLVG